MAIDGLKLGLTPAELQRLEAQQGKVQEQEVSTDKPIELANGEVEEKPLEDVENEFLDAEAALQGAEKAKGSAPANGLTPTGPASEKVQEEIDELEEKKAENIEDMEAIEEEIDALADAAAENIAKAKTSQETAVKENKDESKDVVDQQLQAYIAANKEGGEGMTREELQKNIKGALPNDPELGDALSAAVEANEQLGEIDGLLGDLNSLIMDTQAIQTQIDGKSKEMEAAIKADNEAKCCDPIGFTTGEGENQVEYNFFTDKDGDGDLSQTNEFLGADNQWAEMQAADLDQDGSVTAAELAESGIQLKGSDGSTITSEEDYTNMFGADFSIDLNSYEEGGSHANVQEGADADGDGVADQELLGTFNVNANGESVKGYNTLDDVDWLSDNYGVEISDEAEMADKLDTSALSQDLKMHGDFYNMAFERNEEAKKELQEIESGFNISEETANEFKKTISKEAAQNAANFIKSLDKEEEESEIVGEDEKAVDEDKTTDLDTEATDETTEEQATEDTTIGATSTNDEVLREEELELEKFPELAA